MYTVLLTFYAIDCRNFIIYKKYKTCIRYYNKYVRISLRLKVDLIKIGKL